ncbi:MAG: hypothetical protein IKC83_05320 [Clostridia bacterium]|nr:hypothetical protein [Clostridia bacterium]
MIGATDVSTIIISIVAICVTAVCVIKIREIKSVQGELNSAIVLVPLFKNRIVLTVGIGLLVSLLIGAFYLLFTVGYVIAMLGLIVMLISIIWLFCNLFVAKFAVLDSGVLLPYKFVEWSKLYDYILDEKENSVMFTGDSHGRYTLSSTSIMMKYNPADLKKLQQILAKNKIKHKINL